MSQGKSGRVVGILGRPYLDLEPFLDLSSLAEVHEEICLGLTRVAVDYTGGSHRTLGIVPESQQDARYADYGEVLRALSPAELATFATLSDSGVGEPAPGDPGLVYGEERELPLSRRQMLWLKFRYGVYFPWQVYFELVPNRFWSEKSEPKSFSRVARAIFPKTVAFVEGLPFLGVGRCNIMGLEANHHGTVHRDGEREQPEPAHFITLCPAANKTLFLWDESTQQKFPVASRAYWFNDNDYHGVEAAPFFRYSLRVDGHFQPEFLGRLRQEASS